MLSQRLTSKFRVVSIYDESTLEIDDRKMTLYVQTRDISLIENELSKLSKKATVFHCLPLQADKEYLTDGMLDYGSETSWNIFRHHVKSAENFRTETGEPLIRLDDSELVSNDCRTAIPRDIVQEIASVIMHKANESTKPFTMPDTWLRTRIRARAILALIAEQESAKKKDTE